MVDRPLGGERSRPRRVVLHRRGAPVHLHRRDAHVVPVRDRQHLPLEAIRVLVAVVDRHHDHVHVVLGQRPRRLGGVTVAGEADEAGHAVPPGLPQPGQRAVAAQHLLRVARTQVVDVGDVDPIGAQVAQRLGERIERLPRGIDRRLGGHDHLVPALGQHLAELPVSAAVSGRGVQVGDAQVDRQVEQVDRFPVGKPHAAGRGAAAQDRHLQPGLAQPARRQRRGRGRRWFRRILRLRERPFQYERTLSHSSLHRLSGRPATR